MRVPDLEAVAAAKIAGALVTVRDLNVRFHTETETVCAVNGVDLDLEPREVLCILGESGSGKSVLLRELMRLNPVDRSLASGSIRVAGHDMMATPRASARGCAWQSGCHDLSGRDDGVRSRLYGGTTDH